MTREEEISARILEFRDAYNAGDLVAIAGYYSDSLVKLREGAPPEAKADVISRVERVFREFTGALDFRTMDNRGAP